VFNYVQIDPEFFKTLLSYNNIDSMIILRYYIFVLDKRSFFIPFSFFKYHLNSEGNIFSGLVKQIAIICETLVLTILDED